MAPFRLPRKRERITDADGGKGRFTVAIKSIEPVARRSVRCIKVAAGDGLFLAGHDLIVTHNTFTVGNLLIGLCLEFPNMRVAWTSHHNRTTTNTFRSMQGMVKRKGVAPYLSPKGNNGIRTANGEQEIEFRNGSLLMFGAREQGFGRGMDAIDIEVFDEAQILSIKALEDMVPATNQARHPHGGLIFFLGTPPRPTDDGEAFTAKRQKALDGKTIDQMYVEIGAAPDTDPDDYSEIPTYNPSYPLHTPLESIMRMRENIPDDDSYRREAMGIWPTVSRHTQIVSAGVWNDRFSFGPEGSLAPRAIGVDMSHRGDISIAGCWVREGFPPHVEELWSGSNVAAAIDYLLVNGEGVEVVIDAMSPAAQMVPTLSAKLKVRRSTAGDMGNACLLFETLANSEGLTHGGEQSVTDALRSACKRPIGDAGKWGIDRRDSTSMIYPLVAVVLALLGAEYAEEPMTGEAFFL